MYKRYVSSAATALIAPWLLGFQFARTTSWQFRRWLITLFFAVFGSVVLLEIGDGLDHYRDLQTYYAPMSTDLFLQDLWRILTFQITESRTSDVYKHVLSYLVGTVLGIPALFFPLVAAIYGYFFGGAVLIVLRNFRLSKENYVVLAFVGIFLFVRGLEGFYTVRTWTGMWILVYSCLKYYETHQRRYLVLMFLPPFIHIGFFLLAIPAWAVLVLGSRPKAYTIIFLISSITTVFPVEQATTALSATERGASQVRSYLVEEQVSSTEALSRFQGTTVWYNAYRQAGFQRWAPTLLVLLIVATGIYWQAMTRYQRRIFSIGVLTLAFSNATWFLYAVHNRSLTIATIFLLAGFLLARLDPSTRARFSGLPQYYRWGMHLCILLFLPLILFHVSMTLDWMSVFILGFPFLVWIDPEINMSMKQFLRQLVS